MDNNKNDNSNTSSNQPSDDMSSSSTSSSNNSEESSGNSLTAVLEKIEPDEQSGKASLEDIVSALESRGFGPLLFAPALIAVLPTGGIPGVPTVCGIVIALISIQMIFGRSSPWLPNFINKIEFDKEKLDKGVGFARKVTTKIDKISKPRLEQLSSQGAKKVVAAICILAALSMMPLEAVPFAVMIPAASIMLFSIGLITKDGYFTLTGILLNLATLYFIFSKVLGGE